MSLMDWVVSFSIAVSFSDCRSRHAGVLTGSAGQGLQYLSKFLRQDGVNLFLVLLRGEQSGQAIREVHETVSHNAPDPKGVLLHQVLPDEFAHAFLQLEFTEAG